MTAVGIDTHKSWGAGKIATEIFERLNEHDLVQPTFVYDFPASQAALARIRPGTPPVAERFELFWKGIELANGFHELTDAAEQERRFVAVTDGEAAAAVRALDAEGFAELMAGVRRIMRTT